MTTAFCRGCINYTVMDDGRELCLYDEEVNIHEVKTCPDDDTTEDDGSFGSHVW